MAILRRSLSKVIKYLVDFYKNYSLIYYLKIALLSVNNSFYQLPSVIRASMVTKINSIGQLNIKKKATNCTFDPANPKVFNGFPQLQILLRATHPPIRKI